MRRRKKGKANLTADEAFYNSLVDTLPPSLQDEPASVVTPTKATLSSRTSVLQQAQVVEEQQPQVVEEAQQPQVVEEQPVLEEAQQPVVRQPQRQRQRQRPKLRRAARRRKIEKKAKGRPGRHGDLLLAAGLKEFFKADGSCDKYFGSTWTSHTFRNWTNYISDVEKLIRGAVSRGLGFI